MKSVNGILDFVNALFKMQVFLHHILIDSHVFLLDKRFPLSVYPRLHPFSSDIINGNGRCYCVEGYQY